jgi:psp operon transcriptional activator
MKNVVERAVYTSMGEDEPIDTMVFDPFESPWRSSRPDIGETANEGSALPDQAYDFKQHVQDMEISLLQDALKRSKFNQKKTAEFLGMTYHQLRGYLRKYELTDTSAPEQEPQSSSG